MFDVGFWELFLIFMLLLFVVGPEKLPIVAGFLGKWFGKLQRYFFELKDSIQQETSDTTGEINKIVNDQKSQIEDLQEKIKKANKED